MSSARTSPVAARYNHMLMRRLSVFMLVLAVVGGTLCCCATQPSVVHLSTAAQTPAQKPFPVPIVVLHGDSDQLGEQHGQRLTDSIHLLHDKYLTVFIKNQTQRLLAVA